MAEGRRGKSSVTAFDREKMRQRQSITPVHRKECSREVLKRRHEPSFFTVPTTTSTTTKLIFIALVSEGSSCIFPFHFVHGMIRCTIEERLIAEMTVKVFYPGWVDSCDVTS